MLLNSSEGHISEKNVHQQDYLAEILWMGRSTPPASSLGAGWSGSGGQCLLSEAEISYACLFLYGPLHILVCPSFAGQEQ